VKHSFYRSPPADQPQPALSRPSGRASRALLIWDPSRRADVAAIRCAEVVRARRTCLLAMSTEPAAPAESYEKASARRRRSRTTGVLAVPPCRRHPPPPRHHHLQPKVWSARLLPSSAKDADRTYPHAPDDLLQAGTGGPTPHGHGLSPQLGASEVWGAAVPASGISSRREGSLLRHRRSVRECPPRRGRIASL